MKAAFLAGLLLNLVAAGAVSAGSTAEFDIYGTTDFHASGDPKAHETFIQGLLKLHNFEYEDARASFLAVQEIDPDFAMAYWGEALTWENPLWNRFNTEASRAVLARLGTTPEERAAKFETDREKAYLRSIEALFAEGSQREREIAYSAALNEIYTAYPDDLDAAALYAPVVIDHQLWRAGFFAVHALGCDHRGHPRC